MDLSPAVGAYKRYLAAKSSPCTVAKLMKLKSRDPNPRGAKKQLFFNERIFQQNRCVF